MAHANSGFSNTEGKEICTRGESLELGGNELADPAVTGLEGEEHRVSRDASEPTLCNMDDAGKITDRVAALMMLGNAVVPQQAEHAFRTLASRINDAR